MDATLAKKFTRKSNVTFSLTNREIFIAKSSYFKAIIFLICTFPISTLFQDYLPAINIILVIGLVTAFFLFFLRFGFKKGEFAIDLIALCIGIVSLLCTELPLHNLNIIFYFPIFVIVTIFFQKRINLTLYSLVLNKNMLLKSLYIWSTFIVISIFLPSSYTYEWDNTYFSSFTDDVFRLAPTAVLEMAFLIFFMAFSPAKKYLFLSLIPLFCFFSGGSRTYFVLGILSEIILIYFYIRDFKKILLIFAGIGICCIPIFLKSSIYQKFVYALQDGYYGFWGTFTSGRSVFWGYDLYEFFKSPLINLVIGRGYNFVYDVNFYYLNNLIWAHNDFIQILATHGFVGLFAYLYVIWQFFAKSIIKVERRRVLFPFLIVFLIWFFNAFVNMFYTYFCSMLCLPIYASALKIYAKKGKISKF